MGQAGARVPGGRPTGTYDSGMSRKRRQARALLRRAGYDVRRVRPGAWLVQRRQAGRPSLSVRRTGRTRRAPLLLAEDDGTPRRQREHRDALERYFADEHLAWVLRRLRIDCVLDVGANRGQFARRLRRLGFTGRIVSFEPVPHLVADLRRAAAGDPAWFVHARAVGERDGTAEINVVPGKMSSLLQPNEFGQQWATKLQDTRTETVELCRLDAVFDEVTAGLARPRVLLKLDTQGFDLPAFRGAGGPRPEVLALQSELAAVPIYADMPRMSEQLGEYEAAGFEVSNLVPVTRHRASMRVIELDVLMVRTDAG